MTSLVYHNKIFMKRSFYPKPLVCAMALLSLGQVLWGQNSAMQQTQAFSAAATKNAALLRTYSWQMSVQATIDGDQKPASVYQLRFDINGNLVKTLMTAPPPPPSGLGKRIRAKKLQEFKEWGDELADLVKKYMAPSAGTMLDFYSKSTYQTDPSGLIKVSGTAFLQPGDNVSFLIDPTTNSPKQFTFSTTLESDAVTGMVTYAMTADGLRYAAQIQITCPAKKVTSVIQNYGYVKQQ
jgi:hypothetical protein